MNEIKKQPTCKHRYLVGKSNGKFECVDCDKQFDKLPEKRGLSYAVTGTFHGSIVEAESEGEARRIFHKHYNGESITHIRKRGNLPAWAS